jgi:hypothetical protein
LTHQVVDGYVDAGGCCLYLAYEQSPRRLEILRMSRKAHLTTKNLRDGRRRTEVTPHVERVMVEDRERCRAERFRYLQRAPRNPADAIDAIRRAMDGFDADGFDPKDVQVVIDASHNLRGASDDRRMDIEIAADAMKDFAVELDTSVLAITHTNEAGQVRESRYFEYCADVLLRVDVERDKAGMDAPIQPPMPPADRLGSPYPVKARKLRLVKQKEGLDGYSANLHFHTAVRSMTEAPDGR